MRNSGTAWHAVTQTIWLCSKPVGRRPRKRGTQNGSKRGLGKDKVPVVVARARVGATRAIVLPERCSLPHSEPSFDVHGRSGSICTK